MVNIQKSFNMSTQGTLYLVPTPIGNLEDMTYRAVNILNTVDIILSEDTRHTQKLLNHFNIIKKQLSLHEHNIMERTPEVIAMLKNGLNFAQVSDAGMPSISDPGKELVAFCVKENINVVALPGANAGLTALIASGIAPQPFYFHGFLPRKKSEQLSVLNQLRIKKETLIFYESPNRLKKTINNFIEIFDNDRQVVVCRELTKKYEEYIRGTLNEVYDYISQSEIKGEICIVLSGCLEHELQQESTDNSLSELEQLTLAEQVDFFIAKDNLKPNEAIKKVAKNNGLTKQEIYKVYHT